MKEIKLMIHLFIYCSYYSFSFLLKLLDVKISSAFYVSNIKVVLQSQIV